MNALEYERVCRAIVVIGVVFVAAEFSFAGVMSAGHGSARSFDAQRFPRKTPQNSSYFPDRIIVKLKPGTGQSTNRSFGVQSLDVFAQQFGARSTERLFPEISAPSSAGGVDLTRLYTFWYDHPIDAFKVAGEFMARPEVEYAEPWFIYQTDGSAAFTPSDTNFIYQWALRKIQADSAWTISQGDTTVILAIDDTGVEWDHPDLVTNIWYNPGELGTDSLGHDKRFNGIDDDGDGKIDDWHGWDFAGADINNPSEDNDPRPTGSNTAHGTHVAGIASAATNNVTGIAGVGFKCRILPLKASADNDVGPGGFASISAGFPAMVYAAQMGATAVNCSWGGPGYSQFEQDVVNYVTAHGTLVIAAAGNGNSSEPMFPASYSNVISVAATTSADTKAGYSNYGPSIDVCAPGGDQLSMSAGILSTEYPGTYSLAIGTSHAAPHVTGLAGLVHTVFPTYTPLQIGEQIRVTCDDIGELNSGFSRQLGKGRINAFRALTQSSPSVRVTNVSIDDHAGGNGDGVPDPGETLILWTTFTNFLMPTSSSASVTLTSADPYVHVLSGTTTLGTINTMQSLAVITPAFQIQIDSTMPVDHVAYLAYNVSDGAYMDFDWVGIPCNPSYRTQWNGTLSVTFTNNGGVGFNDVPNNSQGEGFIYQGSNQLFEGGLLIGNAPTAVVDVVRNATYQQDADFLSHGIFRITTPTLLADAEGATSFTDSGAAANRLGIHVDMSTFTYKMWPYQDFVILRFKLRNITPSPLTNVYAGLFMDWDMRPPGGMFISPLSDYFINNRTDFDSSRNLGYAWYDTSVTTTYCGVRSFGAGVQYFGMPGDSSYVDRAGKWRWLSGPNQFYAARNDVCFCISSGPYTIPPDSLQTVGFALVGGKGLEALQNNADTAAEKWQHLEELSIPASIDSGWNLVSLPVGVPDDSVRALFPTSVGNGFAYEGSYVAAPVLARRRGYWLRFPSQINASIVGSPIPVDTIPLVRGWNLIGSISAPVAVNTLSSEPPGLVTSQFYRYAGGYTVAAEIDPGRGYWVKAQDSGKLVLNGGVPLSTSRIRIAPISELPPKPPGVCNGRERPAEYVLEQNFPNPFNPSTTIRYALPSDSYVSLKIYDVLGQLVTTLSDGQEEAGYKEKEWNAASVSSGLYFCRLEATSISGTDRTFTQVMKMLLLK